MNYSNGRMWDEFDKAINRITELESENEKLKTRLETAGDDVMEIISAALSGDCQKYINFDIDGNKYCKWGVVEKDIRAIFEKGGE